MMNVVDDYNGILESENMSDFLVPVSYAGNSMITCFKLSADVGDNAILQRIDRARCQRESTYWKWAEDVSTDAIATTSSAHTTSATTATTTNNNTAISMKDIIASLRLPSSRVSVSRAVKKLSDRYASEFDGAILGNMVPLSRREFIVNEMKRQFCDDFHYVQHASIGHRLPAEVRDTLADLMGTADDGGRGTRSQRSSMRVRKMTYVRTGARGDPILDFLVHHALQWNAAGFDSVDEVLVQLHASWPANGSVTVPRLQDACFRRFGLRTKGTRLHVADVGDLLRHLLLQGVVKLEEEARVLHESVVDTSSLQEGLPSPEMVAFMLRLADSAGPKVETVEITGRDVLAGLNHGSVGAYRMPCVPFFIGPFVSAGVVVWRGTSGQWNGKYLVYVNKIRSFVDESKIDKK
jgi:hypothetical protein